MTEIRDPKKKICWITPDYFFEVDADIVPFLSDDYEIEWILINTHNSERKFEGLVFDKIAPREYDLRYRQKDPRIILQYLALLNDVRKLKSDLIYTSFHGLPYWFPLLFRFLDPGKMIYGVHNVSTPEGASNERMMRRYQAYVYKRINNFQVFSEYQLRVIKELLPQKNSYYVPLSLTDYGSSNIVPPADAIRFLFFGYIRPYKRLDLLIAAFQDLCASGVRNIELHIAGDCEDWHRYHSMIDGNDRIKTRIGVIPSRDVPDLIASCHYLVLPYQDSAQSAVLTLSYRYGKPVIASDIDAFSEFVSEGLTGFFFENRSSKSLTSVMRQVIADHTGSYDNLRENIAAFVKRQYSPARILQAYKACIDQCLEQSC